MRVGFLTAALLAGATVTSIPARADDGGRIAACASCECPPKTQMRAHPMVRHEARIIRENRRIAMPVRGGFYQYAAEYPVSQEEWHGRWRQPPNDGYIGPALPIMAQGPGPAMADGYGPPSGYYEGGEGPRPIDLEKRGWTGGVGYNADGGGGGGGGFTDGYGQVHFSDGGSAQNGPTYNDYGQSFQSNPSTGVAGPFQARLMGSYAPAASSSK